MTIKAKVIPACHPNVGTEMMYRRKLDDLIRKMNRSYMYWVVTKYRNNEPEVADLAQDELPSTALKRALRVLAQRWGKQFDDLAPKLAKYFAKDAADRSDAALTAMLRRHGMTVKFRMTPAARDVLGGSVAENVSLIKSIPKQYHLAIEGKVMRAVQQGRKLKDLTDDLQKTYGVTRRRAILIAKDQNNKAHASMQRARQLEIGIKEAIWLHSAGGREPRPSHVANSGKRYDLTKGWYDPDANGKGKGAWILPGQLINCRCVSRSIIPALDT